MTTLDHAIAQMRAAGMPDFPPDHPRVNAGRITRYGPKKKAWYILYEYRSSNGRYYITGAYGQWGGIEKLKIETDWAGMEPGELERVKRSQTELERRQAEKRAERARFAGNRARMQWESARSRPPEGVPTYLDRKGVEHEKGLRYFADGTLLVPMIRYDITEAQEQAADYTGPRRLAGLQKIAPDGVKRFNKGMAAEAAMCRLGGAPRSGELILLTEGLATGLTLRMATQRKYAVFNAFNAGNLPAAAKILRALYPKSPILFCADDDAYLAASLNKLLREEYGAAEIVPVPSTQRQVKGRAGEILVSAEWSTDANGVQAIVGAVTRNDRVCPIARANAGRTYAHRASAEVGNAAVVYPQFVDRLLPAEPDIAKRTDFNDLHKAEGLAVVTKQLATEIERLELSQSVRALIREEVGRVKREAKGGGPKKDKPERPVEWDDFYRRYTLIYPSDTVWDAQEGEIVKLSHVRIMFSDRVVQHWLDSPHRRTVLQKHVVFEPGAECPDTHINLFRGMPLKPSRTGSSAKLLELLQFLCGEADQDQAPVTDWVTKWIAYQLQHVGAKMATAIVMHGTAQGTGKNLFWSAVRAIFGQYGGLITQSELESPYNSWMSRRLFMIANEVISRQELRHHVGRLKNMITEMDEFPIGEKYLPLRYEDNHMNMVFLTNELHALQIEPGDRRYMVVRTPPEMPKEFYAEVVAEIAAGGAAALYAHLLEVDLADFSPHTKPLLTMAKEDLIEMGYSSVQFFQQQLYRGLVWPLPYGPCRVQDLYRVYTIHCARTGERNPARLNRFSHEFMSMNGVSRRVMDVGDPDKAVELSNERRRQATVFLMGEIADDLRGDDKAFQAYVKKRIAEFRLAMREFMKGEDLPQEESQGLRGGGAPLWYGGVHE